MSDEGFVGFGFWVLGEGSGARVQGLRFRV